MQALVFGFRDLDRHVSARLSSLLVRLVLITLFNRNTEPRVARAWVGPRFGTYKRKMRARMFVLIVDK